jgi:RNA polymerase sigma-70 factor, ECF subfamily
MPWAGRDCRRRNRHPERAGSVAYTHPMWPSPDSTRRLLDDAKTGDHAAVDRLLGEFREPLRKVIGLRLDPVLGRRVDASDIVQDVLIEANQRLTEYLKNPQMPFHLWLRHLAQDRIIDTHRRHRQAQRRSIDKERPIQPPAWADQSSVQLVAQLIDTEQTPASAAIQQELQRRLGDALTRLPDDDREVILMRHHEQLSNQEVAAALGLTEAAASMRYLRALRKLRAVLVPDGEGKPE